MTAEPVGPLEARVLILAPFGKDAALTAGVLNEAGISSSVFSILDELVGAIKSGAGALLLVEEVLLDSPRSLIQALRRQPAWSDLPLLVLTRPGADSAIAAEAVRTLGNVTLLERPIRVSALLSAVRTALRARRRQYELRAQLAALSDADQRKDEFLATLAHELRNPLAPIRNAVHIVRIAGSSAPAVVGVCEMMERQVNHMVRLVDDLMEVSRITCGKIELRKEPIELAAVVHSAVETSRPLIESQGHDLTIDLLPEPVRLQGDFVRLAQVFANLLNNAAKYQDAGGRIEVSARTEGGQVTVTVADHGVGIPSDMLSRVFDMFTQGSNPHARGGLGIGLTLVRTLVEMHGGRVEAHSAGPGRGSEFVVRLPLLAEPRAASTYKGSDATGMLAARRLLVVDDNRDAADSLGLLLRFLGAEVAVAYDGRAALEMVENFRPSVILLDIGMPGMDGYDVARSILERPERRGMMLIAMTGWSQEADRRRSRAAGFHHHLIKPVEIGALKALLARPNALEDATPQALSG